MFTGIVEELGALDSIHRDGDSARLRIRGPLVTSDAGHGDSISVNGVCLTVTSIEPGEYFDADVMAETLDRTALGALGPADPVNLERAMRADARFGGHIVQGHVDGVGEILAMDPEGDGKRMRLAVPGQLTRYMVEKGSITVDGVSLTIAALNGREMEIALIPHSLQLTTLGLRTVGEKVNLEVDVFAKYVESLLKADQ